MWDTPDFDSISAGTYREAVLAAAGLADRIVLALSKWTSTGTGASGTCWRWCAAWACRSWWWSTSSTPATSAPCWGAFERHHEERFGAPAAADPDAALERAGAPRAAAEVGPGRTAVTIDADDAPDSPAARVGLELPADFVAAANPRPPGPRWRPSSPDGATTGWRRFERRPRRGRAGWRPSTRPSATRWRTYERRWLEDEARYDTFERTLAELLVLLEIPGLAKALGRARQAVTWPARTLFGLGRGAIGRAPAAEIDREAEVLLGVFDEAATALRERVLERLDGGARATRRGGARWSARSGGGATRCGRAGSTRRRALARTSAPTSRPRRASCTSGCRVSPRC